MDLNTSLTHKMSRRKTTLYCFIEILYNFLCKTPLNIHHFQWKAKGRSSRLRMWDHVPVFWTSSSNVKPSAPASNMSLAANSHQINWSSYKFPPRSTVSLMKVLNQITCFLSLQSFCVKRNTGPEQSLARICRLRNPFSSGWLWVHASRTSQNKDHMCLFNVNQTRGWKSPTSCLSAASEHVEGYEECLWVRETWGRGLLVGLNALNLIRYFFFAWPQLTRGRPRHKKEGRVVGVRRRGGGNVRSCS